MPRLLATPRSTSENPSPRAGGLFRHRGAAGAVFFGGSPWNKPGPPRVVRLLARRAGGLWSPQPSRRSCDSRLLPGLNRRAGGITLLLGEKTTGLPQMRGVASRTIMGDRRQLGFPTSTCILCYFAGFRAASSERTPFHSPIERERHLGPLPRSPARRVWPPPSAAGDPEAGASRRMPARRPAHPVSAAQRPSRSRRRRCSQARLPGRRAFSCRPGASGAVRRGSTRRLPDRGGPSGSCRTGPGG